MASPAMKLAVTSTDVHTELPSRRPASRNQRVSKRSAAAPETKKIAQRAAVMRSDYEANDAAFDEWPSEVTQPGLQRRAPRVAVGHRRALTSWFACVPCRS